MATIYDTESLLHWFLISAYVSGLGCTPFPRFLIDVSNIDFANSISRKAQTLSNKLSTNAQNCTDLTQKFVNICHIAMSFWKRLSFSILFMKFNNVSKKKGFTKHDVRVRTRLLEQNGSSCDSECENMRLSNSLICTNHLIFRTTTLSVTFKQASQNRQAQ